MSAQIWVLLCTVLGGWTVFQLLRGLIDLNRISTGLRSIPKAPGQWPILGNAVELIRGCPWEIMHGWVMQRWPIIHCHILHVHFVLVGSAEGMKEVFLTGVTFCLVPEPKKPINLLLNLLLNSASCCIGLCLRSLIKQAAGEMV